MISYWGVDHGKDVVLKAYQRRSAFDSYEPTHRQTTFATPKGRVYNVDRKMKRTMVALNRGGVRTFASDQGDARIRDSTKDAYVAFNSKDRHKLEGLPKRFRFDPPGLDHGDAVRFRSGPVVGAVNRRRMRQQVA